MFFINRYLRIILLDSEVSILEYLIYFNFNYFKIRYLLYLQKSFVKNLSFRLKVVREHEISLLKSCFYSKQNILMTSEEKMIIVLNLKNFRIHTNNVFYIVKDFGNSKLTNIFSFYLNVFLLIWNTLFSCSLERKQEKFSFFIKTFHTYSEFFFNVGNLFYKKGEYTLAFLIKDLIIFNQKWILNCFPSFKYIIKQFLAFFSDPLVKTSSSILYLNSLFLIFISFSLNGLLRYFS